MWIGAQEIIYKNIIIERHYKAIRLIPKILLVYIMLETFQDEDNKVFICRKVFCKKIQGGAKLLLLFLETVVGHP